MRGQQSRVYRVVPICICVFPRINYAVWICTSVIFLGKSIRLEDVVGQILFLPQRIFISQKIGGRYDNIAGCNSHFHRTA